MKFEKTAVSVRAVVETVAYCHPGLLYLRSIASLIVKLRFFDCRRRWCIATQREGNLVLW